MNYMLTNDGIELLAKVNAGMALHLTKAESGSGYSSIPFTLPAVVDKKQTLQIDSVNAEAGIAVINCVLSNLELEAEYSLRQIGIYARDTSTQKEILFIIGQQFNGDPIPAIAEMEVEYTYIIGQKISNTSDIKIDIGANDFVRKQLFYDHVNNQSNPHKITKTQIGLDMVDNTADINKPISTATQVALDAAYANGNAYTDVKIASLINGAPETLDTLKEVANAIESNKTVVEALDAAIGTKANKVEVDAHMDNTTVHITKSERDKWNAKQNAMTVDTALSATSTNPIQNKAVKTAFDQQTSQNSNFTNSINALNGSLIASGSRTLLATSTTNGAWITTNLTNDKVSNYKHLCLEVLANENRSVIGNIPVSMIFYGREQHLYDLEFYSSGAYIRGYIKILLDTSISIYAGLSSYSLVNAKLYGIK